MRQRLLLCYISTGTQFDSINAQAVLCSPRLCHLKNVGAPSFLCFIASTSSTLVIPQHDLSTPCLAIPQTKYFMWSDSSYLQHRCTHNPRLLLFPTCPPFTLSLLTPYTPPSFILHPNPPTSTHPPFVPKHIKSTQIHASRPIHRICRIYRIQETTPTNRHCQSTWEDTRKSLRTTS